MNEELIDKVIEKLNEISAIKAKFLIFLTKQYEKAKDNTTKAKFSYAIRRCVYYLFLSCLSKKSKREYTDAEVILSERLHEFEYGKGNDEISGWKISNDGATKTKKTDNKYQIAGFIPREYQKGFVLGEKANDLEKDLIEKKGFLLKQISIAMDRKLEATTFYETKNNIPKEFVELLIDYLKYDRVPEKGKEYKKS